MNRELEIALLNKLSKSWSNLNQMHFGGRLKPTHFTFSGPDHLLGAYQYPGKIYINRDVVLYNSWSECLIPILKHEMVHQYLMEHIDPSAIGHGPLFRKLCREIGACPKAASEISRASVPSESTTPPETTAVILRKVEKLMSLAQSSNQHEAELAMAKANELLLKFNIEYASHHDTQYCRLDINLASRRTPAEVDMISSILCNFYFVDIVAFTDWDETGAYSNHLAVMGTHANVKIAEYTFHFLRTVMDRLWREYKNKHRLQGVKGKRDFLIGVGMGFYEKLDKQRGRSQEQGLVWKDDPRLRSFVKNEFPYTRSRHSGDVVRHGAYQAGLEAGNQVIIHKGIDHKHTGTTRYLTT